METQKMEFAVMTNRKEVSQIGRSVIYHPQINYKGKGTKWFDDSKLIRKGGAA